MEGAVRPVGTRNRGLGLVIDKITSFRFDRAKTFTVIPQPFTPEKESTVAIEYTFYIFQTNELMEF